MLQHVLILPTSREVPSASSLPGWRALILRLGHHRAVALLTLVSVLMSLVLTTLATWWTLDMTVGERAFTFAIAIAVPGVIAPLVGHVMIGLVLDLDRAQTELARLASRDPLTGVFNRGFFMERLEAEAGRHFRTGDPLTLVMLDADHFKSINDTFGHTTGDRALVAIATTCESQMRATDVFARYGGEEFVALLPATSRSEGAAIAERIREAVASLHLTADDGRAIPLTVSVGISILSSPDPGYRRLFDSADGALYDAKRGGRNRCVMAERSAHEQ
ncbi:MAG: GGDEF domain-containing protein [Gemmatimonadaceae bacterium]|nr:GGDEF domain-containing protein [Gemmatimonadaceae bacterium]